MKKTLNLLVACLIAIATFMMCGTPANATPPPMHNESPVIVHQRILLPAWYPHRISLNLYCVRSSNERIAMPMIARTGALSSAMVKEETDAKIKNAARNLPTKSPTIVTQGEEQYRLT